MDYGCPHLDGVLLCLNQLAQPQDLSRTLDLGDHPELAEIGAQRPDLGRYDALLEAV